MREKEGYRWEEKHLCVQLYARNRRRSTCFQCLVLSSQFFLTVPSPFYVAFNNMEHFSLLTFTLPFFTPFILNIIWAKQMMMVTTTAVAVVVVAAV